MRIPKVLPVVLPMLVNAHGNRWCKMDSGASNSTNCFQRSLEGAGKSGQSLRGRRVGRPNVLFIMADQMRYDALGFVQERMSDYAQKLHVRTPNIDRLARRGVYFETTYCVSPSCAPSRAGIKTGCTLQRTGILDNKCVNRHIANRMRIVKQRIADMVSFEQILVQKKRYVAETYGKWHAPIRLYYRSKRQSDTNFTDASRPARVIDYNVYGMTNRPRFEPIMDVNDFYRKTVAMEARRNDLEVKYRSGAQESEFSGLPYTPIRLDSRYDYPAKTPLSKSAGFKKWQLGLTGTCGVGNVPANYSATSIIGNMALSALHRLAANQKQPFLLSVHFNAPHPPMVASPEYFSYYYNQRERLFVSPSIDDKMRHSAYNESNQRRLLPRLRDKYGWDDPGKIVELTAAYYAMIEELDDWVGELVKALDQSGLQRETIVIFTSDHGEMMGAHSMLNKAILLEEAARVPLVIKFPGVIQKNSTVNEPVSHMDLHSTLLDYCGAKRFDKSDGASLRRFIERKSYNKDFDERVVVVELDERSPLSNNRFSSELGEIPNFMIRKGNFKLILTKLAKSPNLDMMYNLTADPYEVDNILAEGGTLASDEQIGKAEHLKALLMDWMVRMNGPQRFYSDNKYNLHVGKGDLREIKRRRTWRALDYWESDSVLSIGPLSLTSRGRYIRREYFYVGRSREMNQPLILTDIHVDGKDSNYFTVKMKDASIEKTGYLRIMVSLIVPRKHRGVKRVEARLEFNTSYAGYRSIPIELET